MKYCFVLFACFLGTACVNSKNTREKYDYANQALRTIPDSVYSSKHLKKLYFNPTWISVTRLGSVGAGDEERKNQISSVNKAICALKELEVLNLSYNKITQLPACFYDLPKLEELDLSFNKTLDVDDLLAHVNQLKSLKKLNLWGIPSVLADTSKVHAVVDDKKITLTLTMYDFEKYKLVRQ